MSSSKGKMKSDYASVTDQAGIYAGDGGFVILRTLVKQEKMLCGTD